MKDLESVSLYTSLLEEEDVENESTEIGEESPPLCFSLCELWKVLLCGAILCFSTSYTLFRATGTSNAIALSFGEPELSSSRSSLDWHIKPIKPYHHGRVVYLTEEKSGLRQYTREFTIPCGDGLLVFNVGPALDYLPYAYDVYEDAYIYSNNEGLCVLYPSYKGIQTEDYPMWEATDATDQEVDLGDLPTKISARVVKHPKTGNSTKKGGDFLVMRGGNFYNPTYYKHLQNGIHSWRADADVEKMMGQLILELDELFLD